MKGVFIAQEVENEIRDAVDDINKDKLSIDSNNIILYLVEVIKILNKKIDDKDNIISEMIDKMDSNKYKLK